MNRFFTLASLLIGLTAVAWLCVRFGLGDLRLALKHVRVALLLLYGGAAGAVLIGYSLRWRGVARGVGGALPLRRFVAARLAGDAVGAVLPGGKVAGDPVRAALVYADGLGGVRASAGVAIDRVLELMGNSLATLAYVGVFSWTRAADRVPGASLLLSVAMLLPLLALAATVAMLWAGRRPFSPVFRFLVPRRLANWIDIIRQTEDALIRFFGDHPATFLFGLCGSLLIETLIVVEYHFLFAAFGLNLDLSTVLMTLLASGLARLVPTPAGLGALEASQVTLLAMIHGAPATGFVVGMVMRLHETVWMVLGLLVLAAQGVSVARLRMLAARKLAA